MSSLDQHRKAGRPRWWVAGLSVCLLVASGVLAWSLTRDDTYVAQTPRTDPQSTAAGAGPTDEGPTDAGPTDDGPTRAAATLAAFESAVRDGDREAARALAPAGDRAAGDHLAALVGNAEALDVRDFSVRYVDEDGAPSSDGSWDAAADATWRFRGFDRISARAEVEVHLVDDGDRVALTGFGGGGKVSPVWLSGPVQVRRSPSTLVIVAGDSRAADRYAARAEAAVPAVRRVLPDWRRGLVVEVPASTKALEQALGAGDGDYDQIAAVTTSADGSTVSDAPVHVFANPEVFGSLRRTGAQVVMSHEATHVAAGAWDSTTPLWLLEGFADYVALRDMDLPVESSAAQIIAAVRRSGPPRQLPDAAAFGTRTPRLGATYESAWLACRLIAQQRGERELVAFYRAVDRGQPLAAALRAETGMSVPQLTAQWRSLLEGLAG